MNPRVFKGIPEVIPERIPEGVPDGGIVFGGIPEEVLGIDGVTLAF